MSGATALPQPFLAFLELYLSDCRVDRLEMGIPLRIVMFYDDFFPERITIRPFFEHYTQTLYKH